MANTRGLDGVFRPRSVAVIGASRRVGSIGRQVVSNLIGGGFQGPVYPVNPKAEVVLSIPAYKSVRAIKGPVDLAVLVVPPDAVLEAAEQCGRKGVKGLVVITAGFREIGGVGAEREDRQEHPEPEAAPIEAVLGRVLCQAGNPQRAHSTPSGFDFGGTATSIWGRTISSTRPRAFAARRRASSA